MREVVEIQCGRVSSRCLLSAPSGQGLLTPAPERLQQLLQLGSIHDVYLVENLPFARGQFASVRKCTHKVTGERFAAKVLRKRRRLGDVYHEIAILDAFADCDRIVQLHEVYETNTEIIILLELATGGEVQTLLDVEEYIREQDVIRLMKQILEGLHHLHDNNIAHLDIKPQNLLLTGPFPDCDVKLCDFGISRQIGGGDELREIMGTADYMAPEILNYEPLSLATDMWSIGVLTYALLTGYTPFTGSTVQETYCNITSEEVDFPEELFSEISAEARDFVSGLLVKNPSGRRTIHDCLEHPWLSISCLPTTAAPSPATCIPLPAEDISDDNEKDSGFSSPASSDDENSLPYTSVAAPQQTQANLNTLTAVTGSLSSPAVNTLDNAHSSETLGNRVSLCAAASTATGGYTIETALPVRVVDAVDNAPPPPPPPPPPPREVVHATVVTLRPLTPPPSVTPLETTPGHRHTALTSPARAHAHHHSAHHHHHHHEEEVSDVTSEASSSDRTSDMSWEDSEPFQYRRLSVAQLTDRVWDCFNEHDFASEHVRPWENVCSGAVGRAKAMFQEKSSLASPATVTASRATVRAAPLHRPAPR